MKTWTLDLSGAAAPPRVFVQHRITVQRTLARAILLKLGCLGLAWIAYARITQAAVTPPGVPEPGLVLWGTVVNQTNGQPITITSASWAVTDGAKTALYSAASLPPTRIVNFMGQSFYVLEVPFDTRQIGTVTLADPATVNIDSFVLKSSSPPTYTLTPTINGVMGNVRAIDGAPSSGGSVPVAGFTSATRGRVIRVDLGMIPVVNDYNSWAVLHFGSASIPDAAPTADPDGDGLNNLGEYLAGTDPKDPNSVLRILGVTVQTGQAVLGWKSVTSHSYLIETAPGPEGPWSQMGPPVLSAGATTQRTNDLPAGQLKEFYRIRLAPQ